MTLNASFRFINTDALLRQAVDELASVKRIGVDCETAFWKLGRDYEKLALVQIAYEDSLGKAKVFVIDAMAHLDCKLLHPLLEDESIAKAMHNASFDCSKLSRHWQIDCRTVWCTYRAEKRAGRKKGLKLDALAMEYFHIEQDKAFQLYDWSIRPLPQKVLVYAAADAVLTLRLMKEQEAKGLNGWYTHVLEEEGSLFDSIEPEPIQEATIGELHEWLRGFISTGRHRTEMPRMASFFLDSSPPYFVWDLESFAPQLEEIIRGVRDGKRTYGSVDPANYYDSCAPPVSRNWGRILEAMHKRFELKELNKRSQEFEAQQAIQKAELENIIKEADDANRNEIQHRR